MESLQPWELGLFVLVDRDLGSVRLVFGAPVVLVDGNLATRASAPRGAAGAASSSLCAPEVEGLGQDNHARRRVTQVRDQLVCGAGVDRGGRATASDALGETLCCAGDTDGSGSHSECCKDGCNLHGWGW